MALVLRKGVVLPADNVETIKPSVTTTKIEGYFGMKKFTYNNNEHSMLNLNNYVAVVMNNSVNWASQTKTKIEMGYCRILLQMFYTIANYNSYILPNTMEFRAEDCGIEGLECMYMNCDLIYFNCHLIELFLSSDWYTDYNITFSQSVDTSPPFCKTELNEEAIIMDTHDTLLLYKLFIIADHFATHYFEDKKNYIFHGNFGKKGFFTFHSQLHIETTDLQTNVLRPELTRFLMPMSVPF